MYKKNCRRLLSLIFCAFFYSVTTAQQEFLFEQPLNGVSFFNARSQSTNAARHLAGMHPHIHYYGYPYDNHENRYVCTLTPIYGQSLRPEHISESFFGTTTLTISGSQAPNRENNDLLADYFGLSTEFQSTVNLRPFIRNVLLEPSLYIALHSWCSGLYIHIHVPVGWTQWRMNLEEEIFSSSTNSPFPAGYQSTDSNTTLNVPFNSFESAIMGMRSYGSVRELSNGLITDSASKGGASDLQFLIGWDFTRQSDRHAGFNIRVSAPTGSRPESILLFQPILGNGKHWEIGAGFSGHVIVWEEDNGQELGVYSTINVMHIIATEQNRSFDFINNGFGSRYILLKEFDEQQQFTGNVVPAINVTTLACKVHNDIQVDFAFMFGYTYDRLVFDIGYNGWVRTRDKIRLDETIPANRFGFKGIQNVSTGGMLDNNTESSATLMGAPFSDQTMRSDPEPIFIRTEDLDISSAASKLALTHKLFFYLGYAEWYDPLQSCKTFFGTSFEIEFEGINPRNSASPNKPTLSQWMVWIRGGIEF